METPTTSRLTVHVWALIRHVGERDDRYHPNISRWRGYFKRRNEGTLRLVDDPPIALIRPAQTWSKYLCGGSIGEAEHDEPR
jgi:hypothetical protein